QPMDVRNPDWLEAIRAFVQRWGLLGICRHRLPAGHVTGLRPSLQPERCRQLGEQTDDEWRPWEPLVVWQNWARQARAILNLAEALAEGERGDHQDWKALNSLGLAAPDAPTGAWGPAERLERLAREHKQPDLGAVAAALHRQGFG